MVKRKIIWSHRAKIKLYEILQFYIDRNQSNTYSKKLYKELKLLKNHPDLGTTTELENIKGLIIGDYIIFYQITEEMIIVHSVWDCRQNPENLKVL